MELIALVFGMGLATIALWIYEANQDEKDENSQ